MTDQYASGVSDCMNNYKFFYNNKEFDFHEPRIMAIMNLTPDSFYDGGRYSSLTILLKDAEKKTEAGAYILDLGAQSTRPGAQKISAEQEWERLKNPLSVLRKEFPYVRISVDTFYAQTARWALEHGADMINDVSGFQWDNHLLHVLKDFKCPYVLTHSRGTPDIMMHQNTYHNLLSEMDDYFFEKIQILLRNGISNIILDPGFGFAKNIQQNFLILKNLHRFKKHGFPLMAGISRKSMVYKTLHATPTAALNGTTALHFPLLMNGASILRVHDVKEAMEILILWKQYENA